MMQLSVVEWLFVVQVGLTWLWMAFKTGEWFMARVLRWFTGRTPKGRVENAVNNIIGTYSVRPGDCLTLVTGGGHTLIISRGKHS